jgi:hypothetical protein
MSRSKQPAKHGIQFDFIRHIQIHRNVLSGWASSMVTPQVYTEIISGDLLELSVKFQFAHNGYEVEVQKFGKITFMTDSMGNKFPHQVITTSFGYAAFNQSTGNFIRICSPHEYTYNPNYPWHSKPHRHDLDNAGETITIYSDDDRPLRDRLRGRKYTSGKKQVEIEYTDEDWHHLSEFYSEIFKL